MEPDKKLDTFKNTSLGNVPSLFYKFYGLIIYYIINKLIKLERPKKVMHIPDTNPLLLGKYFMLIDRITIKGKPQKNVRLRLTSVMGKKYFDKLPIYLIWKEYNGEGHYLICYPKEPEKVLNIIKNMIYNINFIKILFNILNL